MMSPSHFFDNDIGGSSAGINKTGLTDKGREWVRQMEARHMIIDLAHASPKTIDDVLATAIRPVVVSHTGVKGTCNNNRNLSDDQIQAVAAKGGLIGIGYWDTATCGTDAQAIVKAMRYVSDRVGVEHVALGSDFDGAVTTPFDTTGLVEITDALLQAGYSEHDIQMIMGGNTMEVSSHKPARKIVLARWGAAGGQPLQGAEECLVETGLAPSRITRESRSSTNERGAALQPADKPTVAFAFGWRSGSPLR